MLTKQDVIDIVDARLAESRPPHVADVDASLSGLSLHESGADVLEPIAVRVEPVLMRLMAFRQENDQFVRLGEERKQKIAKLLVDLHGRVEALRLGLQSRDGLGEGDGGLGDLLDVGIINGHEGSPRAVLADGSRVGVDGVEASGPTTVATEGGEH